MIAAVRTIALNSITVPLSVCAIPWSRVDVLTCGSDLLAFLSRDAVTNSFDLWDDGGGGRQNGGEDEILVLAASCVP